MQKTLEILFANERVIAVDKPCGWLSVPSRQGRDDLRACVGIELAKTVAQQIWPVHRLDYEVSGILFFAKDAQTHRALSQAFEQHSVKKTYQAYTTVGPEDIAPGTNLPPWTGKMVRGKKRAFFAEYGKPSQTLASYLGTDPANGWHRWQLQPVTGRSHQLRLDLAGRGWPIVGDVLYGGTPWPHEHAIALRAVRVDFAGGFDFAGLGLPDHLEVAGLSTFDTPRFFG